MSLALLSPSCISLSSNKRQLQYDEVFVYRPASARKLIRLFAFQRIGLSKYLVIALHALINITLDTLPSLETNVA